MTEWEGQDVDEIATHRTLNMLFSGRERIDELHTEAAMAAKTGEMAPEAAYEVVGQVVLSWLNHVQKIVRAREMDLDGAEELWHETRFGEITVDPVADFAGTTPRQFRIEELDTGGLEPRTMGLVGLNTFFEDDILSDQAIVCDWSEVEVVEPDSERRRYLYDEVTVYGKRTIPMEIWMRVVRECDVWLQDIGIGVDLGDTGKLFRVRNTAEDYDEPFDDSIEKPV